MLSRQPLKTACAIVLVAAWLCVASTKALGGVVTTQPSSSGSSWTWTYPSSPGTSGYVLSTDGTGVMSWVANGSGGGVTSFSAGTTGFTPSTATTGAITLGGTLAIVNGGTGSATATGYSLFGNNTASSAAPAYQTAPVLSGAIETLQSIGATSTDGIVLLNSTSAANNAQQWSPRVHFSGRGWETTGPASQAVDMIMELQPVQGTANPRGNLTWSSSVNGAAYSPLMTLTSGGYVGIGTTSPAGALDVYGSTYPPFEAVRTGSGISSPFGVARLVADTNGGVATNGFGVNLDFSVLDTNATNNIIATVAGIVDNSSDTTGDLVFTTRTAGVASEKMRILYNGNVGIGTTSPGGLLTVGATSSAGGVTPALAVKQIANGDDTISIQRYTDTSPTGDLIRAVNAGNSANLFIVDTGGNVSLGVNPGVYFSPTGSSYFNGGNVGIGTAAPAGKLDVEGSGGIILNAGTVYGNTAASGNLVVDSTSSGTLGYIQLGPPNGSGSTSRVYVGGTVTQNFGLSVGNYGGTTGITFDNLYTGGGNWSLVTSNTSNSGAGFSINDNVTTVTRFYIAPTTGNVGIGTTSPAQTLSISGNEGINAGTGGVSFWIYGGNGGGDVNQGAEYEMTNLNASSGVRNKYIRVDSTGDFQIINSAYSAASLSVTDAGVVSDNGETVSGNATISGSVGIGTTSPASLLQVSGSDATANGKAAAVEISNTASGGGNWYMRAGASGNSTPAGGLSIANDVNYMITVTSLGNVGIGTLSPNGTLEVYGGHLLASRGGISPSISSCGGSGSSVAGSDNSFLVTTGTSQISGASACTVSFGTPWATAPNACVLTAANQAAMGQPGFYVAAISTTQVTFGFSTNLGNDNPGAAFYVICM